MRNNLSKPGKGSVHVPPWNVQGTLFINIPACALGIFLYSAFGFPGPVLTLFLGDEKCNRCRRFPFCAQCSLQTCFHTTRTVDICCNTPWHRMQPESVFATYSYGAFAPSGLPCFPKLLSAGCYLSSENQLRRAAASLLACGAWGFHILSWPCQILAEGILPARRIALVSGYTLQKD